MVDKRLFIEQLFRQNYNEMFRLARTLLGDAEEADDVVQDVFLKIAKGKIQPEDCGQRSYLFAAVRNASLNKIRQLRLHEKVHRLLPIDYDADFQQGELLDDIMTIVDNQLEEPHRSIFHLRFDNDLTVVEIAHRLGLNPNTTYKYLMNGIQIIRNHFNH